MPVTDSIAEEIRDCDEELVKLKRHARFVDSEEHEKLLGLYWDFVTSKRKSLINLWEEIEGDEWEE